MSEPSTVSSQKLRSDWPRIKERVLAGEVLGVTYYKDPPDVYLVPADRVAPHPISGLKSSGEASGADLDQERHG